MSDYNDYDDYEVEEPKLDELETQDEVIAFYTAKYGHLFNQGAFHVSGFVHLLAVMEGLGIDGYDMEYYITSHPRELYNVALAVSEKAESVVLH